MKDVYKLMNEIDADLDEYDISELSNFEKKKIKKRMKKKLQKRNGNKRSILMTITAAAILLFSFGIGTQSITLANMPVLGPLLEEYLGVGDDQSLENYKTILGQTVESEQGSMTLNEVLIDEGRLLINSSFQGRPDAGKIEGLNPFPSVYINGEAIPANGGGDVQQMTDSTYSLFSSMDLQELDLAESMDIKIAYADIGMGTPIKGDWTFEFTASGEALLAESTTIPISREFTLENGQRIVVDALVLTPASSTLTYHLYSDTELDYEYDIRFMVEDETGKNYEPTGERTLAEDSYFRFDVLAEDVITLKVTPFLISGKEGEEKTDIHQVLKKEAFEVNLR